MINHKPIPLGDPLELTDEDLEDLTDGERLQIEMEIKTAAAWRALVPKEFKSLLDAQPAQEDDQP